MSKRKKYSDEKRKGNIGEALVQYILSRFCLVHKIDGSYDVGNDFICELLKGEYPANLLFYVQVKNTKEKPTRSRIGYKTIRYWEDSPIPVFVFWVKNIDRNFSKDSELIENIGQYLQYKRYTPILHNKIEDSKVGFKPFALKSFIEDLLTDHMRCQFVKGLTPMFTFKDFPKIPPMEIYPRKVIEEYENEILIKSWSNLLSVAILFYKKGLRAGSKKIKEDHLNKAQKASQLARAFFPKGGAIVKYDYFWKMVKEYERLIDEELKKI